MGSKGNVLWARELPRSCTRVRGCRPGEQAERFRGREVLSATSLDSLCPSPPCPQLCKCQPCESQGRTTSDSGTRVCHHRARDQQLFPDFTVKGCQYHLLHPQPPTATDLRGFPPPHSFTSAMCAVVLPLSASCREHEHQAQGFLTASPISVKIKVFLCLGTG